MPAQFVQQRACCYWFTGLSGAGKSTLSREFASALRERGYRPFILDGDDLRKGLNKGLGYSRSDRAENIRRIAEVARLMVDAGLIVLVAAISPYREDRSNARALFAAEEFFEVFVNAPLATCVARDPKGLYKEARKGRVAQMTGLDDPYEIPLNPVLVMPTAEAQVSTMATELMSHFIKTQKIV